MELKIDLLGKKEKSKFRIIYGISVTIIAILYIVFVLNTQKEVMSLILYRILVCAFALSLIIGSVFNITEGLGYKFDSFFGKAYILINSEIISLKSSIWNKEQFIYWSEIKSMDYKIDKFNITKTDGTNTIISISNLDYTLMREIKETVDCIAKEKNIQVNFGKWN